MLPLNLGLPPDLRVVTRRRVPLMKWLRACAAVCLSWHSKERPVRAPSSKLPGEHHFAQVCQLPTAKLALALGRIAIQGSMTIELGKPTYARHGSRACVWLAPWRPQISCISSADGVLGGIGGEGSLGMVVPLAASVAKRHEVQRRRPWLRSTRETSTHAPSHARAEVPERPVAYACID